ncbi:MAG: hypothetical protein J2P15_17520 [Micromonosporaceae bacterium]|nr:hypothetical protein [Micromonosporaceae bacterium]
MDTVEWGTGNSWLGSASPAEGPAADRRRVTIGWLDRPVALGLIVLGVAGLIVAQVVSWGHIASITGPTGNPIDTPPSSFPSLYLESMSVAAVIAYDLGLLPLLGFAGAALVARPANRRSLAFAGIGVAAGLAVLLAGLIRGLLSPLSSISQIGLVDRAVSVSVGPGPYAAGAALCAIVAALVLSLREPRRTRVPVVAQRRPPEQVPEQPLDLTVTAAPAIDQRLLGPGR